MENKNIENILNTEFKFASSMPQWPHWYTVRKNWENDQDFVDAVMFIRENGYPHYFNGREYIYFTINGIDYWTMGAPINRDGKPYTIIINKAKHEYETEYDRIADVYDNLFITEYDIKINKELFALLNTYGNILDIGCGTGLFLDYNESAYNRYFGIDMSANMIKEFRKKHVGVPALTTSVKDFYTHAKYDTIIALFGIGSYLTEEEVEKAVSLVADGGRIYLMAYKPDYVPLTYTMTGIRAEHHKIIKSGLRVVPFHEYEIYTNDEDL